MVGMRALLCSMLLLAACPADDPVVRPPPEAEPPPVLPTLEVSEPARAAFLPAGPVQVRGRVTQGDAAISAVSLNEAEIGFNGEGWFEGQAAEAQGVVVLGLRATDADGERVVDGRAVHVGPVNPPGHRLQRAVGIQLGAAFLDDDHPDLDDVAGLVEAVVEDPDFGALIGGAPISSAGVDITITSMTVREARVDVVPLTGLMQTDLNLYDVEGTFRTSGLFNTTGTFWMDEVEILLDVDASVVTGSVVVDVPFAEATIDGFGLEADGIPGWLGGLLTSTLESKLEDTSRELVGDMLRAMIDAFTVDLRLGAEDQVRVATRLVSVEAVPQGLIGWMDAHVEAMVWGINPPLGAGSLATPGEAPTLPLPGGAPFYAVVDDDLVNQAAFGLWAGGLLEGISFSGAELIALSGEDLPPPLGPVNRMSLGLGLPPVVRPSSGERPLRIGLGELALDIERADGEHVTASVNLDVGGELALTPSGLGVALDNRPAQMSLHVGMLATPPNLDPGDLASLFRLSTPALLGRSSSIFPGYPLPEVELGELVDVGALRGVTWGASELQTQVRPDGWMVMSGTIGPMP